VPRRKTIAATSREANIVADWIDLFAPVILRELRAAGAFATKWPRSVAIDSHALKTRLWRNGLSIPPGREAGEIFLAMGTDTPNGEPRPVAINLMGGKDHQSVLDFFATLPGEPEWVVTDDDAGLEKAISIAWPNAVHYRCEAHLMNLAKDAFLADKLQRFETWGPRIGAAIERAQHTPDRFNELKVMVNRLPGQIGWRLKTWVATYEPLIMSQIALRAAHPGMTRSIGAVETPLGWIEDLVADRHGAWRNLARVNNVLGLMMAHYGGVANETRYLHFIRRHLEANNGATGLVNAADYKRFRDRVGASSLRALVAFSSQRSRGAQTAVNNASRAPRRLRQMAKQNVALATVGLPPTPTPTHHRRSQPRGTYRSVKGKHVSDFPEFAAEWHKTKNGSLKPSDVAAASGRVVWWQCLKGHEWERDVVTRLTRGLQCPYCTNRRVDASNSLATLRPDLAAEWDTQKNAFGPDQVTLGADRYAWWVCKTCGHRWQTRVLVRGLQGAGCPNWQAVPHPDGRAHPKGKQKRVRRVHEPVPLEAPAIDQPAALKEDPDFPFD
jgi:hypothetical protein